MVFYLILCKSLTYAQRTARVLERGNVGGYIMRTPQKIAINGCGYCVKVSERHISRALVLLKEHDLSPKQVFVHNEHDAYEEVSV